jgi:hypothetical protein
VKLLLEMNRQVQLVKKKLLVVSLMMKISVFKKKM